MTPAATDASGTSAALSIRPSRKSEKATAPRLARGRRQRRTTAIRSSSSKRPGSAIPPTEAAPPAAASVTIAGPPLAAEEPLPAPGLEARTRRGRSTPVSTTSQTFAWWIGQPWIDEVPDDEPSDGEREGDGEDVEEGLQPHKGTNRQPRGPPVPPVVAPVPQRSPSAAGSSRRSSSRPSYSGNRPSRSSSTACMPDRERALDVVLDRVADHHRLGRLDREPLEHGAEDRRGAASSCRARAR